MMPTLNIFGLALPLAPFSILIGIWVGLSLVEKHASKYKLSSDSIYNLIFNSLIAGIVGARLTYILLFSQAFIDSPASILSINFGLFDLSGGIAFAVIYAIIYGQKQKLSLSQTLDGLTLFFATLAIALGVSNFASGNSYGLATTLPWSINLWGADRHPTQIYAIIGALFILIKMIPSKKYSHLPSGKTFLIFLSLTSTVNIFISTFIGNSILILGTFRIVQLWWLSVLLLSLYLLNRIYQSDGFAVE